MRVKEPPRALPEETRSKRPAFPRHEESSDDVAEGVTCQHLSRAVSVSRVKKGVTENPWSVCGECLKERGCYDGQPALPSDIWLCLKCGFQGCGKNSESQHALKHCRSWRSEPHCVVISLSSWVIWCYECDEKLLAYRNKKALSQTVDFLQKHASKTNAVSKIIRHCEENCETRDKKKGRKGGRVTSVKGIINLGNTCFLNAVLQNLAQSSVFTELISELKENVTKLKIFPSSDPQLDPLVVDLSSPGPLTSALFLFLQSMKETEKGPVSPKILFNQLCQKAPRFKSFQQQDSQELLHYLLDALRTEETKRIQASILKAFNNPTTKTADDVTRKKVKAYGREGVKMNFIDRIFLGELTSTVMCEECANVSTVKDPFIDISLPVIEERVSKPVLLGKMTKYRNRSSQETDTGQGNGTAALENRSSQETDTGQGNGMVALENTPPPGASHKQPSSRCKNHLSRGRSRARKLSSGEGRAAVAHRGPGDPDPEPSTRGTGAPGAEGPTATRRPESSADDADSEASGPDSGRRRPPADRRDPGVAGAVSRLRLSDAAPGDREPGPEERPPPLGRHRAFRTLPPSCAPSPGECSVQSCLCQFTAVELLMGSNKLLCDTCAERKRGRQGASGPAGKQSQGIYTNARKQLLISAVPAVLILHLKRFHQAGLSLRKVNRHVDFPLRLDLAPFCSAACKTASAGERLLYGLCGGGAQRLHGPRPLLGLRAGQAAHRRRAAARFGGA